MDNIPHEILQGGGFIGPRFTGVFFFEDVFWRVAIPLVYGTRAVDALDALRIMPREIKQRLFTRENALREYLLLWADCFDYDTGFQDSHAIAAAGSFLGEMIDSTERELTSAIADLCQHRPNSKAMQSARDATEKAFKAYLAYHTNLIHAHAKKQFGHKLDKLIQEVARHTPQSPLLDVGKHLDAFAPYDDRYSSTTYTRPHLWRAYRLAQFTAAEVLRSMTGRNQRAAVERNPVFNGAPGRSAY
jgi:hypothetical protein